MKTAVTSIKPFLVGLLAALILHSTSLNADDWPHWLGPNGDNKVAADDQFDPNLNNWKIAWQSNVGLGYSTVTISNGRAYTMGHDGGSTESVICYDAASGKMLWEHSYKAQLIPKMHVGGPNASVTISGDMVYSVSKDGQVYCLMAKTGEEVWKADLTEVMDIKIPSWGFASSPLEYKGDMLLSAGKVAALDKLTGRPSWVSEHAHHPGYGTPTVFNMGGKDFIAAFDSKGLSILNAANGKEIARHPVRAKFDLTASTPVVLDGGKSIYIHANSESDLLSFDGKTLSSKWSNRKLQNSLSGAILIDGSLYGLNGNHKSKKTQLYSRDFKGGEQYWSVPNFGYASLIAVGGTLLILTEDGELVSAEASTRGYNEISRKKLLDAICWTNPVYANGQIYVRNDHGVLICLERA
ncbi:MAG: PQQ-like beta-propeller repeat protein [Verrucomicrobia bacterium]|nr:PQQ-like beta-propeller repeat protein [Verrucomicrobiota bacterium]